MQTFISQETRVMGADLGTHHFLKISGLAHASNTGREGAEIIRDETSSRSEMRSAFACFFMRSLSFFDDHDGTEAACQLVQRTLTTGHR